MKIKIFCIIISVFLIGAVTLNAQKKAVKYNNNVLYYYTLLDRQIAKFHQSIWDSTYTVQDLVDEYDFTIMLHEKNYKQVKDISPLRKDPGFLEAVINFYKNVEIVYNNEYKQIIDMYTAEDWEDDFSQKIYDLDNQAINKLIREERKVTNAQQEFADIYELELD